MIVNTDADLVDFIKKHEKGMFKIEKNSDFWVVEKQEMKSKDECLELLASKITDIQKKIELSNRNSDKIDGVKKTLLWVLKNE